jgi:hypothetical protein
MKILIFTGHNFVIPFFKFQITKYKKKPGKDCRTLKP